MLAPAISFFIKRLAHQSPAPYFSLIELPPRCKLVAFFLHSGSQLSVKYGDISYPEICDLFTPARQSLVQPLGNPKKKGQIFTRKIGQIRVNLLKIV